jgi:RNA polymerase sigma factor (sigma-70 family)
MTGVKGLMLMFIVASATTQKNDPNNKELEELLSQISAGNRDSLADLYQRTRAWVYGLALSYLKNGHDAEDITQDTFVRIWYYASGYKPKGKPASWILTITKNLSLMKIRQQNKFMDISDEKWESFAIDSHDVTAEDKQVLTAAFSILSDEEMRIIMLHAVTGLKHKEISSILDLPLPTVLSKYHRALQKLKTKLKGDDNI